MKVSDCIRRLEALRVTRRQHVMTRRQYKQMMSADGWVAICQSHVATDKPYPRMPLIAWALKTDGNGDDHVVGLVAVDNCVDEAEIFENFFCYMRECDITPEHIATWAAEHDAFITAKYSK